MQLSIILPCYNVAQYVKRAVSSLLRQDIDDYEVIIVDDGSTDDLQSECRQWSGIDRVKVIRIENQGVSEARNVGLRAAVGDYILFVDPDDWIDDNVLGELLNACKEGNVDALRFGFNSNSGWEKRDYRMGDNPKIEYVGDEIRNELLPNYVGYSVQELKRFGHKDFKKGKELSFVWCFIFRRKILVDNALEFVKGLHFMEDKLFICRFFCYAQKVVRYNKICYHYETRNDGLGKSRFSDIVSFSQQRILAEKERERMSEDYKKIWNLDITPLYRGTLILASIQMFFMFLMRMKFSKLGCVKQYASLPQVKAALCHARHSNIPFVIKFPATLILKIFSL